MFSASSCRDRRQGLCGRRLRDADGRVGAIHDRRVACGTRSDRPKKPSMCGRRQSGEHRSDAFATAGDLARDRQPSVNQATRIKSVFAPRGREPGRETHPCHGLRAHTPPATPRPPEPERVSHPCHVVGAQTGVVRAPRQRERGSRARRCPWFPQAGRRVRSPLQPSRSGAVTKRGAACPTPMAAPEAHSGGIAERERAGQARPSLHVTTPPSVAQRASPAPCCSRASR